MLAVIVNNFLDEFSSNVYQLPILHDTKIESHRCYHEMDTFDDTVYMWAGTYKHDFKCGGSEVGLDFCSLHFVVLWYLSPFLKFEMFEILAQINANR